MSTPTPVALMKASEYSDWKENFLLSVSKSMPTAQPTRSLDSRVLAGLKACTGAVRLVSYHSPGSGGEGVDGRLLQD